MLPKFSDFESKRQNILIVSVSLLLMAIWYIKSPFGSLWLNAGDAWSDGALLTLRDNMKRIPWHKTVFFPVYGIVGTVDSISRTPWRGYSFFYTHWPAGPDWVTFGLDRLGISSLAGKQGVMVSLSYIGLAFWARVWSRWSEPKLGAMYFGIAGLSYWFLSYSTTLMGWLPYVAFLSGLQLWLWTMPGDWGWRRLVGAWMLLFLTSLFALQVLAWSAVVSGGLVLYRLSNLTWKRWLSLMTAPAAGIGSHYVRLYMLLGKSGLEELSDTVSTRGQWFQYLASLDFYVLLALRMEYYVGIGIIVLIIAYCSDLVIRGRHFEIPKFTYLWGITSVGGIAYWLVLPQGTFGHPGTIVLPALAQTALWARLLSEGLRLSFISPRANVVVAAFCVLGLLSRLGIGYFNQIVPIPNTLAKHPVSGVCATDGVMVPAVEALLGVPCPNVGAGRWGGDNLSWQLEGCQGKIREGVFVHFSHVPRVNLPGLDRLYMVYDRWRSPNGQNLGSWASDSYRVPGQPDVPMLWRDGPVSAYAPVYYCVKRSHALW